VPRDVPLRRCAGYTRRRRLADKTATGRPVSRDGASPGRLATARDGRRPHAAVMPAEVGIRVFLLRPSFEGVDADLHPHDESGVRHDTDPPRLKLPWRAADNRRSAFNFIRVRRSTTRTATFFG
jgi:hypothetical protein